MERVRSKQKDHFTDFLGRLEKVQENRQKVSIKARGRMENAEGKVFPLGRGCIMWLPSLCSVRVSCRCVWLIGAEVRKLGCGHLLIIGWKLL